MMPAPSLQATAEDLAGPRGPKQRDGWMTELPAARRASATAMMAQKTQVGSDCLFQEVSLAWHPSRMPMSQTEQQKPSYQRLSHHGRPDM